MKLIQQIYISFVLIFLPLIGTAAIPEQQELKAKMINDFNIIKNIFEVKYAPAEWKLQYAGWELEEHINIAKEKILSKGNITVKDYQKIVKDFFKSTRDYHVGVQFYSTAVAFLPFRLQGTNGRYFVTWVDSSLNSPLKVGDEILQFDGMPIHDAVTKVKVAESDDLDSPTAQALAELFFTMRVGMMGHQTPSGPVAIVAKQKGSGKTLSCTLTWTYKPDDVKLDAFLQSELSTFKKPTQAFNIETTEQSKQTPLEALTQHPYFQKKFSYAGYDGMQAVVQKLSRGDTEKENEIQVLGSKTSFVPKLGKIVWEAAADNTFHAYLYKAPDKRVIGYIRIPSYMGGSSAANDFATLIALFEKRSDALVIDQVNNPGGVLYYMYALASMLTQSPLHVLPQRVTITQEDVYTAYTLLALLADLEGEGSSETSADIAGYPFDQKLVQELIKYYNFIIDEWNKGHYFTENCYLDGVATVAKNPKASYSKPILVLVNPLALSCGDIFPAILQDNKRATIFGTKTAGAGGVLLQDSHSNRFGIAGYSLTGSLVSRHDKQPLENLGVTPDIVYELTEADFQENYSGYTAAIHNAVDQLIQQHKPKPGEPKERLTPGSRK